MKKVFFLLIILIFSTSYTLMAHASTLTFNNSRYEIILSKGITWDSAKAAAEAAGGHLVTITSAEENNFIKNNLFNGLEKAYWLGASQDGDNNKKRPTSNWSWVTGETWSFTDWSNSEPNNAGNYNEIHLSADSRYDFSWNDEDTAVSSMINGYVLEINLNPAATPLPGAIWLLLIGGLSVLGVKKLY